jgi:hypothetical protein
VPRVNYQQVVERLLVWASQPQRTNVGQRDLLRHIGECIEHATLDDDAYAAFLGRFGDEVLEGVLGLLPDHTATPPATPSSDAIHGDAHPPIEEDTSCRTPQSDPSPRATSSPPLALAR